MVGSIGWAADALKNEKWVEYSKVDSVGSTSDWFSYRENGEEYK